jgi:hypothetical protein
MAAGTSEHPAVAASPRVAEPDLVLFCHNNSQNLRQYVCNCRKSMLSQTLRILLLCILLFAPSSLFEHRIVANASLVINGEAYAATLSPETCCPEATLAAPWPAEICAIAYAAKCRSLTPSPRT